MKEFLLLEQNIGVEFKNKDLLTQAFVHRSYLNENPDFPLFHNERLEFLGDAVLELIVTDYLYASFPDKPEGELTSWRAALVNAKMLSAVAKEIGLNDFLLLSRGEKREIGKARDYILANTFEALIGSMYLDLGIIETRKFVERFLLPKISQVQEERLFQDAKSSFQEVAQERTSITPVYRVLKESGPDHAKYFVVGAFLGGALAGQGEGSSKQEAEERAAKQALEKFKEEEYSKKA
ncbi:MAG: ribonuclease III [Parcubacteria group bacterium]|nr:ribonuclease III [Parcubacteria group bacterium]